MLEAVTGREYARIADGAAAARARDRAAHELPRAARAARPRRARRARLPGHRREPRAAHGEPRRPAAAAGLRRRNGRPRVPGRPPRLGAVRRALGQHGLGQRGGDAAAAACRPALLPAARRAARGGRPGRDVALGLERPARASTRTAATSRSTRACGASAPASSPTTWASRRRPTAAAPTRRCSCASSRPTACTRSRQLSRRQVVDLQLRRRVAGRTACSSRRARCFGTTGSSTSTLGKSWNTLDDKLTRGGPTTIRPGIENLSLGLASDARRRLLDEPRLRRHRARVRQPQPRSSRRPSTTGRSRRSRCRRRPTGCAPRPSRSTCRRS